MAGAEHAKSHDVPKSIVNTIPQAQLNSVRVAVLRTCWNEEFVGQLTTSCFDTLTAEGLPEKNIKILRVPGAFELPVAAKVR